MSKLLLQSNLSFKTFTRNWFTTIAQASIIQSNINTASLNYSVKKFSSTRNPILCEKQICNSKLMFCNLIGEAEFNTEMTSAINSDKETISKDLNIYWLAEETDSKGGPVRRSGGRLGKLDAANEAGFFFKTNKSRLEGIKKELKVKHEGEDEDDEDPVPPPKQSPAKK